MKKVLASVFLSLVIMVGSVLAQREDLSSYELIGRTGNTAILVDIANATAKDSFVTFSLMAAKVAGQFDEESEALSLDPSNYMVVVIRANCWSYEYSIVAGRGVQSGKPYTDDSKEKKVSKAVKESASYKVITVVCTEKLGVKV